ncbi:Beta-glucoside bgl operon antiterminator, BglG family [Lachnospiraceae bacterium TWA4]|nr:Beta-glucoside bgl operon antiterminator, BglG family [Lachnospiraceae bacterium TWA4]
MFDFGKGYWIWQKVAERIEPTKEATVYALQKQTERGNAKTLATSVAPEFLEIANMLLKEAKDTFGKVDSNILFPMADHIAFAIKRMQSGEKISNPLTEDIRVLFHVEFKIALQARTIIEHQFGVVMDDDEIGYIALHIHSAIEDEKVSQSMQMARAVRQCISWVEEETGKQIDIASLSYNRLMNHIRYMVARALNGEQLKVSMNDYMIVKFPKAYQISQTICDQIAHDLKHEVAEIEIGYLAMHIARVLDEETKE